MNDETKIVVGLQKGEAKIIQALIKFKSEVSRFGHAMFFERTITVTDGVSLVVIPRGEFLKGIVTGKVLFGSTPSGASATTMWEVGYPDAGLKRNVFSAAKSTIKGKFAVIDVDANRFITLLQAILASSHNNLDFNMIRIGIRTDETGDFWGKPSENPITVVLSSANREFSPLLSLLMPMHAGSDRDTKNRQQLVTGLLAQLAEDMGIEKPEEQETPNENQEH